jgi:polar amino acid transport system permease protein
MATGYTELLRNVPLVVKLFFLYFGFNLGALSACLVGLTLHQSAYISDVIKSGLLSVDVGQAEAGRSLGLSPWQTAYYVVIPQALRIVAPALTNQFIEIIKNSSVAMTITVVELTFIAQKIQQETFHGFEAATAVTLLYAGLAGVVVLAMSLVELRWRNAK